MENYILRQVSKDMTSTNGFMWKRKGLVEAPDWDPKPECGNGLHGWLNGEGDFSTSPYSDQSDSIWIVAKIAEYVDLDGKVKFPRCWVKYAGTVEEATKLIYKLCGNRAVIKGVCNSGYNGTSTSGYNGTSTSGNQGTSTSGNQGTSTSGEGGTSTSGDYGTSTSGHRGTSTSGHRGTSTSGHRGTSTSGEGGTSTSGHQGTSTSGYCGTSTSGHYGTSTSGDYGTSTSGEYGTSTSGHGGTIHIWYHDGSRMRLATGYIGENGLLPNVPYKCDNKGNFYKA